MDDATRLFGSSLCMLVGCYVAGAISLAFTTSAVKVEVKAFWRYEMLTFGLSPLKGLTDHIHANFSSTILLDDYIDPCHCLQKKTKMFIPMQTSILY